METGKRLERRRLFSEGWVFWWFCGYGLDWGTLFIYATVGPGPGVYLLGIFCVFRFCFWLRLMLFGGGCAILLITIWNMEYGVDLFGVSAIVRSTPYNSVLVEVLTRYGVRYDTLSCNILIVIRPSISGRHRNLKLH